MLNLKGGLVLTNGSNGSNGNGVYRTLFTIVATALITCVTTYMLAAKDTVKKEDFDKLAAQVQTLQIETAKISVRLGIVQVAKQ